MVSWEDVFGMWWEAERIYERLQEVQDPEEKKKLKEKLVSLVKDERVRREVEELE